MRLGRHWAVTGLAIAVLMAVPRDAAAFWNWIHELSGPSMMGFGYTCRLFEPMTFGGRTVRYVVGATKHGKRLGEKQKIGLQFFDVRPVDDNHFTIDVPATLTEKDVRSALQTIDSEWTVTRALGIAFDRCVKGTARGVHNVSERFHWWLRPHASVYYSVKHADDPDGPPVYGVGYGGLFELSPLHPGTPGQNVLFYGFGGECFNFWSGGDRAVTSDRRCAVRLRTIGLRINPPEGQRILGVKAIEVGLDTRYFPQAFVPQDFGVAKGPDQRDGGEWTLGFFFSAVLR